MKTNFTITKTDVILVLQVILLNLYGRDPNGLESEKLSENIEVLIAISLLQDIHRQAMFFFNSSTVKVSRIS